jgi:hypothetical protein
LVVEEEAAASTPMRASTLVAEVGLEGVAVDIQEGLAARTVAAPEEVPARQDQTVPERGAEEQTSRQELLAADACTTVRADQAQSVTTVLSTPLPLAAELVEVVVRQVLTPIIQLVVPEELTIQPEVLVVLVQARSILLLVEEEAASGSLEAIMCSTPHQVLATVVRLEERRSTLMDTRLLGLAAARRLTS